MDSSRSVHETPASVATLISELDDDDRKLQEEMEQLKQQMRNLKNSNAFEDTVADFKYLYHYLWSPYVIGQIIIFIQAFLLSFYLFSFLA